jgi:hypothetical protein
MPVSINNTTLTFNDATTQTTAGLVSGGALGTPSSGALTNCTSIPVNQATGTLPVANGGTGLTTTPTNGQLDIGNGTGFTRATLTQGSGITITNGAGSITIAASGSGTVTSVATGNGLSGGTITSTGTLVVACPSFNSVGSYALGWVVLTDGNQPPNIASGGTYAAGGGNRQFQSALFPNNGPCSALTATIQNNLSGTWRNMGAGSYNGGAAGFLICRVS